MRLVAYNIYGRVLRYRISKLRIKTNGLPNLIGNWKLQRIAPEDDPALNEILSTKIQIPRAPEKRVIRSGLLERLDQVLTRKLALVSAPAGYGKTMLLSEWVSQLNVPTAWVSLDASDADVTRFLFYIIAALQTIDPNIGQTTQDILQPPKPASVPTVLTILINDIVRCLDDCALVLDDYHLIESQSVHDAVTFLLDHLPTQMHLVIAARADPPLPLTHLRGRGQLVELRASDLSFSSEETGLFLENVMKLKITDEQVNALTARTEGWIAGLQIAAISLKGRKDPDRFIQSFTGSNRHILDYLLEEVLLCQPDPVQDFVIHTSILDDLTAPLCDAVIDRHDSQVFLELLEKSNLFLVPLDDDRLWYRYHRLFKDLLQQQLRRVHPSLIPDLHRRASRWYEEHGRLDEAIDHALAYEDFDRAAQMMEGAAQLTFMRSEVGNLLRWMEVLPDEMIRSRPSLCIYHAWALLLTGKPIARVRFRLSDAEGNGSTRQTSAEADVFWALIATMQGDTPTSLARSRRALDHLHDENLFLRSIAISTQGMAYILEGDIEAATQSLNDAVRIGQQVGNIMFATGALCNLAGLCFLRAQLHEARTRFEQALAFATDSLGRRLPVAGRALLGLAEIFREWDDLETAARYLSESIELSKRYGEFGALIAYLHLARVKQAQGDVDEANMLIQQSRQLAEKTGSTQLDDYLVDLSQARLWFDQGDLEAAFKWLEERGLDRLHDEEKMKDPGAASALPYDLRAGEQVMAVRIYIAQNRLVEALDLAQPLLLSAEQQNRVRRVIEISNLQALAHQGRGEIEEALSMLEKSLRLAEPGDHVRIFVDEGQAMARLLHEAASQGICAEYCGRLLAAFKEVEPTQASTQAEFHPPEMIEPLSARELEVLLLIAEGLSNRAIADRLSITVSTVKGHASNIYGKLAVTRRTEAIARGRALGLIP